MGVEQDATGRRPAKRTRANGEGLVSKVPRKDGRYAAALRLEDGSRKWVYGKTQREARDNLNALKRLVAEGKATSQSRQPLGTYLAEWLEGKRPSLAPATYRRYEVDVRLHAQSINHIQLGKLKPQDLQALYTAQLAAGRSPATVRHLHRVLHAALKQAHRWRLIHENVADLVSPPKQVRYEAATLTADQAVQLLDAAVGDPFEAAYALALVGLREGEILALRWADVSIATGRVQVRATLSKGHDKQWRAAPTKTHRSRRPVVLTRRAIEALERHRERAPGDRLFDRPDGSPVLPWELLRHYYALLARCGLPRIRLHDLRHTTATLLAKRGIHQAIVADLLGHSTTVLTMDTYSHVDEGMQETAIAALDRLYERPA